MQTSPIHLKLRWGVTVENLPAEDPAGRPFVAAVL